MRRTWTILVSTMRVSIMRLDLHVFLVTLLSVSIAAAFPLPSSTTKSEHSTPTSPRIYCTTSNDHHICTRFQAPIIRRLPCTASHGHIPLSSQTIVGSGSLDSEEERQIRRIMDLKSSQNSQDKAEEPGTWWSIPDVQVVLWFVLLCCAVEGIVSGFIW